MNPADHAKADQALRAGHEKVASGCWEWRRATMSNGYGRIYTGFRSDMSAHRAAFRTWKGEIPEGLVVMHTCDNRLCINPDHLKLGTKKDNSQDMVAKGRNWSPQWQKTSCPRGHSYDTVNINGARGCSVCHRAAVDRFNQKRKATA